MSEGFSTVDRRGSNRTAQETPPSSPLVRHGMTVRRAKEETGTGLPFQNPNRNKSQDEQTMAHLRATKLRTARMQRTGSMGAGTGGGSYQMATGRPRDPMWYWKQNNIPFNFADPEELKRIREFCRILYVTHPLIAACVDIYSKFPLQGIHFTCLAGETRVWTDSGLKSIDTLAGELHRILTTGGKWVDAKFESYGTQRLTRIELTRNGRSKTLYATEGHRWFIWAQTGFKVPGAGNLGSRGLTWGAVDAMRLAYDAGEATQVELAQRFDCSQPMAGKIVRRDSWTDAQRANLQSDQRLVQPVKAEVTTENLRPGMKLVSSYAHRLVHNITPSPFGVAHGFVCGDGHSTSNRGSQVTLFGEKDRALLPYFMGCDTAEYFQPDRAVQGITVFNLPGYFNRVPDIEESASYLYGWLAGYFAADGTVNKKGECFLDSADPDQLGFAELICQRLGIKTYEPYAYIVASKVTPQRTVIENWQGYRLPIDPASLTESFFKIEAHRQRWSSKISSDRKRLETWTVTSVEETDRVEEVYCAVVPGTEAFTLEGNILTGNCKDPELTDFYSELFLDQLQYEDHLLKMNREYWLVGETWSLGGWNETLGIWEGDEVVNPDNVEVENSAFLGEPRFLMQLPESLRTILQTRAPRWQYEQLIRAYPELEQFASKDDRMPVSNVILKQLRFEADTFSNRGIPILMRGMRTIIQEEMLMSAMDAIADRLYTPLILTKLGAKADDLGTTVPWIPDQDELEEFNLALDAALAADFRALTYHWAIDMQAVLGRENVPDLTADFDRIDDRLLMVWGLSRTMLTGANAGETYAADAMNKDVVTQLLQHNQRMHQQFVRERMLIVAEAQEHFDYEVRGGKRYLITEEVYEVDEETGEGKIVEVPKLLVPDLQFKTLNLADEQAERDFREALALANVPVPYKARIQGTGMDFDEMVEERSAEEVRLTVLQAETDKKKYLALKAAGLPIPDELRAKFDPKAIEMGAQQQPMAGDSAVTPSLGQQVLDLPGLAPTQLDVQGAEQDAAGTTDQLPPDEDEDADGVADVEEIPQEGDDVPAESNEQRGRMPKAANLVKTAALPMLGIREVTAQHYVPIDNSEEDRPRDFRPSGRFGMPKHVGMRRHLAEHIPAAMLPPKVEDPV